MFDLAVILIPGMNLFTILFLFWNCKHEAYYASNIGHQTNVLTNQTQFMGYTRLSTTSCCGTETVPQTGAAQSSLKPTKRPAKQ